MTREVLSASAEATEALAARLAERLREGDVVTVSGELGSGKTTFVRGACRALGVDQPVTSPTYTIGHRYHGRVERQDQHVRLTPNLLVGSAVANP